MEVVFSDLPGERSEPAESVRRAVRASARQRRIGRGRRTGRLDGGLKVYAGPLFEWGEIFMDHKRFGLDEEIRLQNRDMWGAYAGAGLTISFLYVGVRAEWLRDWTLKAQAGITF